MIEKNNERKNYNEETRLEKKEYEIIIDESEEREKIIKKKCEELKKLTEKIHKANKKKIKENKIKDSEIDS